MRDDSVKKSKLSWSKTIVRKWFNLKSKSREFHADCVAGEGCDGSFRTSFPERDVCSAKKSRIDWLSKRGKDGALQDTVNFQSTCVTEVHDYRLYVATWNVAGKSPPSNLNLEEWLHTSPAADIYVIGFQEIVPLNAGNVLWTEDSAPAKKWLSLIRRTLNKLPGSGSYSCYQTPSPAVDPIIELNDDFERSSRRQRNSLLLHRRSFQSFGRGLRGDGDFMFPHTLDRRYSVCDRISFGSRPSDVETNTRVGGSSDDENIDEESPCNVYSSSTPCGLGTPIADDKERQSAGSRFCLVGSKQMVGLFLTIWVRNDIRDNVKNLKISCVGRGLMGYLGNKGSISISMSLHKTSFCFVCCHLTSGQKDGDELRRNLDVMEILRKTRFPRVHGVDDEKSPQTILEHDRIIWLGDLNYRVALSYRSVKALVEMHNWKQLLEKDQLRIEQRFGRVFSGWKEGKIYFPPTYKYSYNSDRYAGDDLQLKEKRRTPAWCDRILWYGRGLSQLCYVRGESRFSDHRPVYCIFTAEVEAARRNQFRPMSCSSSRVEVEELLPYGHGYTDLHFY